MQKNIKEEKKIKIYDNVEKKCIDMAPKQENKRQKYFISGKTLKEYDYIVKAIGIASFSSFMISLGTYFIVLYAKNAAQDAFGAPVIVIGLLSYLLSQHGRDLLAWRKSTHSGYQSLNVHLSLGWILIAVINLFLILLPKASNNQIYLPAISDIATGIIIAESILIVLISPMIPKLKKGALSLLNLLLIGLFLPILTLVLIAFNTYPSLIWAFLNFSLLSLFMLFGLFSFYNKKLLKQEA